MGVGTSKQPAQNRNRECCIRPALLQGVLAAQTPVLIFGDSWAEDNADLMSGVLAGSQGWPVQLAHKLEFPVVGNFSKGQSSSSSLPAQLQQAKTAFGEGPVWRRSLVIVHSGGNDFIGAEKNYNPFTADNFWIPHCTWGFKKKAMEVICNLTSFVRQVAALGCNKFLVSELPFTSAVPALWIARLVGVNERGQWMHRQMLQMLEDLQVSYSSEDNAAGVDVGLVPEVEIINSILGDSAGRCCCCCGNKRFFRQDLFHPSNELHAYVADAVVGMLKLEGNMRPDQEAAS